MFASSSCMSPNALHELMGCTRLADVIITEQINFSVENSSSPETCPESAGVVGVWISRVFCSASGERVMNVWIELTKQKKSWHCRSLSATFQPAVIECKLKLSVRSLTYIGFEPIDVHCTHEFLYYLQLSVISVCIYRSVGCFVNEHKYFLDAITWDVIATCWHSNNYCGILQHAWMCAVAIRVGHCAQTPSLNVFVQGKDCLWHGCMDHIVTKAYWICTFVCVFCFRHDSLSLCRRWVKPLTSTSIV